MDISVVHVIFFSPTGGTASAARLIADRLTNVRIEYHDVTAHTFEHDFESWEACIIAFPVYGGRVPEPCLERIRTLHGIHTPAVLVAAFGNRAVDDAYLEMRDRLVSAGFKVIAAAGIIEPHSVNREIAADRPDESDVARINKFCQDLDGKLENANREGEIAVPGNPVYKAYNGLPLKPKGGLKCTKCGVCAANCPAGAIPADNPRNVDSSKCISCMRCISLCPIHARKIPLPLKLIAANTVKKYCSGRKEPEFYI